MTMEFSFYFLLIFFQTIACVHCELANVAFTLGQTNHLYLSHGEQLTYNKIITNLSAEFDSLGSFVSRKPGLYAFHFFSLAHSESRTWIELFKNTDYICSIFGYTSHGYADAGNSVFLHLNEHDTVSIKSHPSYDTTLYGTGDQIYTTFTGVLLNPDDAEYPYQKESFSVGLNHHFQTSQGEIVRYNNIIENSTANVFNTQTGKFTAAMDGTYIFHYHGLAQNDEAIWLELYRNGEYVNSAFGHTDSGYADAGNTVILHLSRGDQVYIKARNNYQVNLYGAADQVYATFSGNLLAPLSHDSEDSRSETSFSVGLSHHFTGTNLIFDRVFSNRGGRYSQVTGHFTAKESGVYVFHFHALSRSDAHIWVDLYHDYHYIDSLYGGSDDEYATGSNAAALNLVAGDIVFLKSRQSSNSYYGAPDQVYCTFSGYKLDTTEELISGNPGVVFG